MPPSDPSQPSAPPFGVDWTGLDSDFDQPSTSADQAGFVAQGDWIVSVHLTSDFAPVGFPWMMNPPGVSDLYCLSFAFAAAGFPAFFLEPIPDCVWHPGLSDQA